MPTTPTDAEIRTGEKVRAARLRRGYSQAMLGERLGVTLQQVQKYETAKSRITVGRLVEIAGVLGVSPATLLPDTAGVADRAPENRDTLEALRLFRAVDDPHVRKEMLALLRALVTPASHDDAAADGAGARPEPHTIVEA